MENVPGILSIDDGSVMEEIAKQLGKIGYASTHKILSAEEFGTPQVRKRVFIVASRVGDAAELLPSPSHKSASKFAPKVKSEELKPPHRKSLITVDAAIGDLPPLCNGGGVQKTLRNGASSFSEFQRVARRATRTLYNHVCHSLTTVNLERIVHVPEGGNWRDIPFEMLPAGMQRARSSDHTKRYCRLHRQGLASTILTKCDPHWGAYVHPTREAARLQGFPDRFRFAGDSISKQYEQVGNAVPIPVARALGFAADAHLKSANRDEVIASTEIQTIDPEIGRAA